MTNGRRRAIVLVLVHLAIGLHIVHFSLTRRSVSPVEPSEAMYTLELGELNAGFLLLLATLLGTLVFGRFFCGWACHLVALQDLCGWIMRRLGVRPRPFRSRLLVWAPLCVAFYMFGWPTLSRWVFGGAAFPGFSNHLVTQDFWKTFPGPLFTVLTFAVCGFAAVYFLGSKGFCTYGCPYGALFGAVDRLSPTRIVVSDACRQCGACTANCTSNVVVHDEVKRYGKVVDPGCMKCMDCVNVCPNGALSLGLARPALFSRARTGAGRPARRYALSWSQELLLAAVFVIATLSFRGLYDGPSLLLAVGLAGITAFVTLRLAQLLRRPDVRLQQLGLKRSGRWSRAGRAFAVLGLAWLLFAGHSAFAQWHRAWGRYHLNRTEAARQEVLDGTFGRRGYSERHAQAAERAARHFRLADRWGLRGVVEVKLGLAWGDLLDGELAAAETRIREAIALAPDRPGPRDDLIELLTARGRTAPTIAALRDKLASVTGEQEATDRFRLGTLLAGLERHAEAEPELRRAVELAPTSAEAHYNLGGVLRRLHRGREALEVLRRAADLAPRDPDVQVELGLACMERGDDGCAVTAFRRAIELAPERPESRVYLPRLIERLER